MKAKESAGENRIDFESGRQRGLHRASTGSFPDGAAGDGGTFGLETFHELRDVEALEGEWRELDRLQDSPFQSYAWNVAWYRANGEAIDEILLFVFRSDDLIEAILPAYRRGSEIRLAGDSFPVCQDLVSRSGESALRAADCLIDWLQREAPTCRFHFDSVSSRSWLCSSLADQEVPVDGVVIISVENETHPAVHICEGYDGYVRRLPIESNRRLRSALRQIDREMPCAYVEIKRNHEIRVDTLESVLRYLAGNGEGPALEQEAIPGLLSFLGELAKDEAAGLQMARLVDQGDMLAVEIGFSFRSTYFPIFFAIDSRFEEFHPYQCLFLSRLNDWIAKDEVECIHFPVGCDSEMALELTGREALPVFTVSLMPESLLGRVRRTIFGGRSFRRETALAR